MFEKSVCLSGVCSQCVIQRPGFLITVLDGSLETDWQVEMIL